MLPPRYFPLIVRQVVRHRARTLLTVAGVATAMFLFCAVQSLQEGVAEATQMTAADTLLVVYRENRYCPFTSRLPEHYIQRIEKIPGVKSVVPMKIVVNNCRTSLDVITFRGAPPDRFEEEFSGKVEFVAGSMDDWRRRTDAALLGEVFARRRGLKVGDRFDGVGVTVYVAGIIRSPEPQDQNVGYVHLEFLQRSTGNKQLGIVTQFNVRVTDPSMLEPVAKAIDAEFKRDQEPTRTSPEKAFVARAAADIINLVGFTKYLGWGCLAAVLALVGNAVVLSVQSRIREHAILQTLGYDASLLARLILAEGLLVGALGGLVGTATAVGVIQWGAFALSTEGLIIQLSVRLGVLVTGIAISAALGVLAGVAPALQAARREIAACFRAV